MQGGHKQLDDQRVCRNTFRRISVAQRRLSGNAPKWSWWWRKRVASRQASLGAKPTGDSFIL